MKSSFWLGVGIISLSGIFNGTFAVPMKYIRDWRWENMWLMFSVFSLLVFPAWLAIQFVPHLWQTYTDTPLTSLAVPFGLGILLGIAQVTYGLGLASVGIAVCIAVVSGVSCVAGAIVPLLLLSPGDLLQPQSILLLVSIPILICGLAFFGVAGHRREREQRDAAAAPEIVPWGFGAGLALCTLTGILGSSNNLGFVFGDAVMRSSVALGGTAVTSTYALWALLFVASFIPNLVYCGILLSRNDSWTLFLQKSWRKELTLTAAMGLLSFAAIIGYGIGATALGKYGTSLGWAVFVATTIIASTLSGVLMDEWRGTSQLTKRLLVIAVAVILASVLTLDFGGVA